MKRKLQKEDIESLRNSLTTYFREQGYSAIKDEKAFSEACRSKFHSKQNEEDFNYIQEVTKSYLTRIRDNLYLIPKQIQKIEETEKIPLYDDRFAKYSHNINFVEINKAVFKIDNKLTLENCIGTLTSHIWPEYATNRIIYQHEDITITLAELYNVCRLLEKVNYTYVLDYIDKPYEGTNPLSKLLDNYRNDNSTPLGSIPFFLWYVIDHLSEYNKIANQFKSQKAEEGLIFELPPWAQKMTIKTEKEIREEMEMLIKKRNSEDPSQTPGPLKKSRRSSEEEGASSSCSSTLQTLPPFYIGTPPQLVANTTSSTSAAGTKPKSATTSC